MKISESNENVIKCLEEMSTNPWSGTIMEGYYASNNRQKGARGEKIVEELLKQFNMSIKQAENPGHDRIINGIKTEIKFSAATERNNDYKFTFNHVGLNKDWKEIIFCGINGDLEIRMVRFNKENLPIELFRVQQGGASSGNDDYMCVQERSKELLFHKNAEIIL